MPDFGDYPPNLPVQDALVVRQAQGPDHAVVPYTGSDLARPRLGPANPFRDETLPVALASSSLKRKNVLTGQAEETFISEHTFRAKHRAVERAGGGVVREGEGGGVVALSGKGLKVESARLRREREGKGDATMAEGDGAYVGPWAKYRRQGGYEEVEVDEGEELQSGEEYEVVDEDEEDGEEVVASGTVVQAPKESLARRKEAEELGEETTTFHGKSETDYLGRSYMHIPQDLDISLTKEVGSVTNYIPKKLIHTWRHHGKPVTSMQLFPRSSHLGLSGGADGLVTIWDVYRQKELLRTFAGHNKAITDLSFNNDGTRFVSGGFDRRIRLWDTETGQCVNRFNCGKTPHVIKFNPSAENGHEFLAGLSDNRILQYDSRAGNETVQEYDHHLGAINTLEFIDENRRFMSTSDDRSLRVWEYGIPVEIKTIRYVSLVLPCIAMC
jgi:pre-mRNA-processing factor 17